MNTLMEKGQTWAGNIATHTQPSEVIRQASKKLGVMLYGALLLALTSWLLVRGIRHLTRPCYGSGPSTPGLGKSPVRGIHSKAPERKPGGA